MHKNSFPYQEKISKSRRKESSLYKHFFKSPKEARPMSYKRLCWAIARCELLVTPCRRCPPSLPRESPVSRKDPHYSNSSRRCRRTAVTLGEAQSYLQGERDHLLFMSRGAGGTKREEGRQELRADLKTLGRNNAFSRDELQPF